MSVGKVVAKCERVANDIYFDMKQSQAELIFILCAIDKSEQYFLYLDKPNKQMNKQRLNQESQMLKRNLLLYITEDVRVDSC